MLWASSEIGSYNAKQNHCHKCKNSDLLSFFMQIVLKVEVALVLSYASRHEDVWGSRGIVR
jgi:hypothetical protein